MTSVPENPYVGLRPFETRHGGLFFGRRVQTAELLDALCFDRFLAVVGTSGCGKSSLVRAGLLPALRGGFLVAERDHWRVAAMKPGSAPLRNLAAALLDDEDANPGDPEKLREALAEDPFEAVEDFLAPRLGKRTSLLLLVDQFEEIFPYREGEGELRAERTRRRAEADDFVHLLLQLAKHSELPIYVVLTMRSDFLGDCDLFFGLPEAMNRGRYLVPRLGRRELREAIEGPARLRDVEVAPRLADRLLNELGDRMDRLPVLQHVLLRTWERWADGDGGPMDLEHYEAVGTLRDALATHAEEALAAVDCELAAKIFQRLADTDPHGRRVRRAASFGELVEVCNAEAEEVGAVLERFRADGRYFLTVAEAPEPSERRVEISHESLIRQWPTLQGWVDEERVARDLFLELVNRTRRAEVDEGNILVGRDLVRFQEWNDEFGPSRAWARRYCRSGNDLKDSLTFLDESTKEQGAARRRRLWLLWGLVGMTIIVVTVLTILSSWALGNADRAEDLVRLSTAREWLEKDPTRAALVLQEVKNPDEFSSAPALMKRVLNRHLADIELGGHEGEVTVASFSPSGELVVTASSDKARVWNLSAPEKNLVFSGDGANIHSATFSSSEDRLLITSSDGTARVWELSSPEIPLVLERHECRVLEAAFSPGGDLVATAAEDGTVCVWDLLKPRNPVVLGEHGSRVLSISFSPSGDRVVTASEDKEARVWNLVLPSSFVVLKGHRARVRSASFSPSGEYVVTASDDGTARVWNLRDPQNPRILKGHDSGVSSASFSPSGDRVVTASYDGTARVWDLVTSRDSVPLRHESRARVTFASFSPSGDRVVTASFDRTAIVWDLSAIEIHGGMLNISALQKPIILKGHGSRVLSARWSPSGDRIVTASSDRTARIWDLHAPEDPLVLKGHSSWVRSASFSLTGDLVVTASDDGTARVWDLSAPESSVSLDSNGPEVLAAFFSPSGDKVATLSSDDTARVWDLPPSSQPILLEGHSDEIVSGSFSRSGDRIVTASYDGTALVWDLKSPQAPVSLEGHEAGVLSASFSPSGDRVVTASHDGKVRVWDLSFSREPIVLDGRGSVILSASFFPSGDRVAAATDDGTVLQWDLSDPRRPDDRVSGPSEEFISASFALSMDRVAMVTSKRDVWIWSLLVRGDPIVLDGNGSGFLSASFSPSGDRVVTASEDGAARVWHVWARDLQRLLRASTRMCLNSDFRMRSLGESLAEANQRYEKCEKTIGYRLVSRE